jgi:hypothetical protein
VAVVEEVSDADAVAEVEPEQSISAAPTTAPTAPKKAARPAKAARRHR